MAAETSSRWSDEKLSSFYAEFCEHKGEMHAFVKVDFPSHARDEKSFQDRVLDAFVLDDRGEPDMVGHRKYHAAQIAAAQAQEKFWIDLRTEIAKKGAIGILVILLGLMATGLAAKFGIGPGPNP